MRNLFILIAVYLISACSIPEMEAVFPYATITNFSNTGPIRASICDLERDPAGYNRKQIEISGFVTLGFENAALFDPKCSSKLSLWVEFGGKTRTRVAYCCNESTDRAQKVDLVVEGVTIPLIIDEQFKNFDALLQQPGEPLVRATLIGWFFPGEKMNSPTGEFWGGYGHFGMNSLFVIQQVMPFEKHDQEGIDYSNLGLDQDLEEERCGSYGYVFHMRQKKALDLQAEFDRGKDLWRLSEPIRVATDKLKELVPEKMDSRIKIDVVSKSPGRFIYRWRPNNSQETKFLVLVRRPYWLSTYAADRKKTIWVASSVVKVCD